MFVFHLITVLSLVYHSNPLMIRSCLLLRSIPDTLSSYKAHGMFSPWRLGKAGW